MLAKACAADVDEVVLDLEDAVTPRMKESARAWVIKVLAERRFTASGVAVRVNASSSPWGQDDLKALSVAEKQPTSVVLPKVEAAADVLEAEATLGERGAAITVQALIETARGLRAIDAIANASQRLASLIIGYLDLASSLGRSPAGAANPDLWIAVQDTVLGAARAAGIQAIDGPFVAIDDFLGLGASALRAADLGFDGKWAIHPSHIPMLTETFTPTRHELEHAREILDLLDAGAASGLGALRLDGVMVDEAMRGGALRILARAGAS
jgi:citrate lyase subunit beta/citryl-CoA lyase